MNETLPAPETTTAADECRHRWLIATPNGPTSPGVCRLCGSQRAFRNSSDDYISDGMTGAGGESAEGLVVARP